MVFVLASVVVVLVVALAVMARLLASARAFGMAPAAPEPDVPPPPAALAADQRSIAMAPPYRLVSSRHGWMLVNVNDFYLGQAILNYGECCEIEIGFLRKLCDLRTGTVLEVGANVGTHSVPLAKWLARQGRQMQVFEPQPFIFQNLCANLALNGLTNVLAWPHACGESEGTVRFDRPDYTALGNFGGVSMSDDEATEGVIVRAVVLDDFLDAERVALMKIDVEGFELHVLRGAERTIDAFRPVLYVENDRPEKSHELIEWLWKKDYRLWWHVTPLFNPDNFFGDAHNRYGDVDFINMVCLPREMEFAFTSLEPIEVNRHPLLRPDIAPTTATQEQEV